jgi:anaerobic selenocysteine-containing dehydrogenase
VELAYALGTLVRKGAGSNAVVLPEETCDALDAFRLPLSAIASAQVIAVVGDTPVEERAPIVDLWLKQAVRNGARIHSFAPGGTEQTAPGSGATVCKELAGADSALGKELRAADRAIVIWSGPGGAGGAHLAALAQGLGLDPAKGSGAFFLPATPNGRGVAEAWAAAGEGDVARADKEIGLLIVSGDEAADDPAIRDLAERAKATIALTMFPGLAAGWADLILPAQATLERDGTLVNLEGRVQRLRRSVMPPVPDELAWIAKLAARFDLELSPHAPVVFEHAFGRAYSEIGEQAELPAPVARPAAPAPAAEPPSPPRGGPLELLRYRPLFAGPAVERVPELQFQRPAAEVELALDDAQRRGIKQGDAVTVRSNGTSVELRARVSRKLRAGVVRVAEEHAGELQRGVEVSKA